MTMSASDLLELKTYLDIDVRNNSENTKLLFFIEVVTGWIEELLNRKLFYKNVTEYFGGTNTNKLLLHRRPVFTNPLPIVWVDEFGGLFGSNVNSFSAPPLVYGSDFCLKIDQDDGTSRSGILYRINDFWNRPQVRQTGLLTPYYADSMGSIKVQYQGGYTLDVLPAPFRLAVNFLVAKLRQIFPYGFLLQSESYEERSLGWHIPQKRVLLSEVWEMIGTYRNQYF